MQRLDPKRSYFLHEIAREGWLGTRSPFVVRRLIGEYSKILHPSYAGMGKATRIIVRGSRIETFRVMRHL